MSAGTTAKAIFSYIFHQVHCAHPGNSDNGFGAHYVWARSLDAGIRVASNHKKPVMVIIHKSWCSACHRLKSKFASSQEILNLSKHFVMVNLADDEEPNHSSFAPDGSYIPRIIFLSPKGSVDRNIYNEEGSRQSKYFYSKPEQIVRSMKKVLHKYEIKIEESENERYYEEPILPNNCIKKSITNCVSDGHRFVDKILKIKIGCPVTIVCQMK